MNITINDEVFTLAESLTISALLEQLSRHQSGTALAVNECVIPRDRWSSYPLHDGDALVVFQVIAGG